LRGYGEESERIDAISRVRERLIHEEEQIAFAMRVRGDAWEDIAGAFGVSRQAAHQRFARSAGLLDMLAAARPT
jgi:predicted RNA polymerase sigma factor